ncbi:rho guanine nucleotide exchange factor 40 isoform X2 [Genypterus blacodes]|uniref:rho guanine nucleotide exchange factor 40 isoform X2 n=1 Tax=Genypterus blacodes TaxID=154954 RepID=UPI003F757AFD
MDSESLDRCIQTALSALYPPFQATSSTVLCQVLNVVESCYLGDGLRYLIHFLLPAKHFLTTLQQDACLPYCGLLFLHEGWPLCVHEKVAIQLCPLDQHLLRQGDFYLLVAPASSLPHAHSASCRGATGPSLCLLVCSLSAGSQHVEQSQVPELALPSLFSMAWLDSVNRERGQRGASRLERCLLTAHGDVFRVPWEDLVYPQFISRPKAKGSTGLKEDVESSAKDRDVKISASHDQCVDTNSLSKSFVKSDQCTVNSEESDSEGEYVELAELPLPRFSPQKGSLTQSISLQHRARMSPHTAATAHTQKTTVTHTASTTQVQTAAAGHIHNTTHTRSAATTHSCGPSIGPCVEVTEENQDSYQPVILTPVSPTSSGFFSPALPKVRGVSGCRSMCRTSSLPDKVEGSLSTKHTQPQNCIEHREQEVNIKVEQEQDKEGEKGVEFRESQRRAELVEEGEEGVVKQLTQGNTDLVLVDGEMVCREEEMLVKSSAIEMGEEEEQCEETDGEGEEDGEEEVEVEEEIQVVVVHQSPERKEREEQRERNEARRGGEESESVEEEKESGGGDEREREREGGAMGDGPKCTAFETYTHSEDAITQHTHTEDTNTLHRHCYNITTQHKHTKDCSTMYTHTLDTVTQHIQSVDFNPGRDTTHTPSQDSESLDTRTKHACTSPPHTHVTPKLHTHADKNKVSTSHTHTEASDTLQTHSQDPDKPHTHTEESHIGRCTEACTTHIHFADLNPPCSLPEESKEANTLHTHAEDVNTLHLLPGKSNEANTLHTHSEATSAVLTKPAAALAECEEAPRGCKKKDGEEPTKKEKEKKNKEEQRGCKEVMWCRAAEPQTEGSEKAAAPKSEVILTTETPPAVSLRLDRPAAPARPAQRSQSMHSSFNSVLRSSGVVCLPGTRDKSGRALLTVHTRNTVWSNPDCDSAELLRLLLYYTSTLRKDVRALGLTVLVDALRAPPTPALFAAFRSLQENIPGSIHNVLILVTKDTTLHMDKASFPQVEVLNSLKSVLKYLEVHQLPSDFGGSFNFSQSAWICFRSRVEQLTTQCEDVVNLLQKTINVLKSTALPAAAEEAEVLLSRYRAVMCSILEDSRLVQLQQEGGASLSVLRREESSISTTQDYRSAVDAVSALYDQVDELLHRLVTLSNSRTQELQFIVTFKSLEKGFSQVRRWVEDVGEIQLKSVKEPKDSLEFLNKKQLEFKDFSRTAYEYCKKGEELLSHLGRCEITSSADLQVYEVKVHSFWVQLRDFSRRVDGAGQDIDRAIRLYRFFDQAYGWALEGMRRLAGITMDDCTLPDKCQAVIGCLEDYHRQYPPIPDESFQEMKALASELRGERGLSQWSFAWSKCHETKKMFDRKMEAALRLRDSSHRRHSDAAQSTSSTPFSRRTLSGLWGGREGSSSSRPPQISSPPQNNSSHVLNIFSTPQNSPQLLHTSSNPDLHGKTSSPTENPQVLPITSSPPGKDSSFLPNTSTPSKASKSSPSSIFRTQQTPLLRRLSLGTSSQESDLVSICSTSPSLSQLDISSAFTSSSTCSSPFSSISSRRQQLRKTQSFDIPATPEASRLGPRVLNEHRGNTGVFIRGLEVSSTEAADHRPRTPAHSWTGQGQHCHRTPGTPRTMAAAETRPRGSKLRHIVHEMVMTEREYVRSLAYIIDHYFPEMERADLPQDLRGKRSVVFGNLEKLLDFHNQFFLKELEACWKHPLRVPHCFLRHKEQFGLYALYSKNKPKSDALLASHGNTFFRRKQVELRDKMDLSSYLLKPVQRMSKYALLLTDIMKEVGTSQEAELVALQAATNMVKFQLRHGNDLLAMDAIRDCDVNLKEQGQLICQDEFTVWSGRKKCVRHVFLFEELVLFSKPKRMEGGLDVFIYKHSFKSADLGLTESSGDDGLRFEVWFRRRTSKNQTLVLQAATPDVKLAWTENIARILWTQATRNKEMRLKEMVSMGVGNKPFLDIQPSDAAINDRAIHLIMKSRGSRTRASIAVSVFDHSNPFKRGAVTSDPGSRGQSSTSLLGPLNLHMYSQSLHSAPAAASSFISSCIEEDELEHETSSQPSMTTESSGSSSRCLSGSTGSDSGCVSAHLQEALPEDITTLSNKRHLSSQYISATSAPVISPATIV